MANDGKMTAEERVKEVLACLNGSCSCVNHGVTDIITNALKAAEEEGYHRGLGFENVRKFDFNQGYEKAKRDIESYLANECSAQCRWGHIEEIRAMRSEGEPE